MGSNKYRDEAKGIDALVAIKQGIDFLRGRGVNPICIVSHPQWTSRGFVFVTEVGEKCYVLVNTDDLNVAMAKMYMEGKQDLCDFSMGVPFSTHDVDREYALGGQYIWTSILE